MTMQKFITIDLQTGKKLLQTIEASFIKFSYEGLPDVDNVDAALKAEVTRALAAEKVLTDTLAKEIQDARNAEAAIKTLIGELESDTSVKEALDRIKASITALTEKSSSSIVIINSCNDSLISLENAN